MFINIISCLIVASIVSVLMGILIGIVSTLFEKEEDKRVEFVLNMLPGYNCGGCGRAGCRAFAKELVDGTADVKSCKPCKNENRIKINEYLICEK